MTGILAPHGIRVEIELKSPSAKLTEEQRMFGQAIQNLGGIYVLYRCKTNDAAKEVAACVAAVRAAVAKKIAIPLGSPATRGDQPPETNDSFKIVV